MSDIHGEISRYHAMLDIINFSADDQLYIIGDVIDRGAEGVEILLEIIDKGNIHLILGNHEDMMLGTLSKDSFPECGRQTEEARLAAICFTAAPLLSEEKSFGIATSGQQWRPSRLTARYGLWFMGDPQPSSST